MIQLFVLAWRNLWRHGRRTLITAGAMAVGVALAIGGLSWMEGAYGDMRRVMIDETLGHVQVHHAAFPTSQDMYDLIPGDEGRLSQIAAMPGVTGVSGRVYGHALLGGADTSSGVVLVGVQPARERTQANLHERVRDGAYLPDGPAGAILLGDGLAVFLGASIGDEVVAVTQAADGSLGNALYTVVGTLRTGSTRLDRHGAFLHLQDLQALLALEHGLHEIRVLTPDTNDRAAVAAVADALAASFGEADVLVRPWWQVQTQVAQMMDLQGFASAMIVGVIFALVALGILNTMLMSVFERTRELGILKAIGMRPRQIVTMVLAESVSLALLANAIGVVLGALLTWYLVEHGIDMSGPDGQGMSAMGMTFDAMRGAWHLPTFFEVFFAALGVAILAALWPAVRAARLEPVAAMREE